MDANATAVQLLAPPDLQLSRGMRIVTHTSEDDGVVLEVPTIAANHYLQRLQQSIAL